MPLDLPPAVTLAPDQVWRMTLPGRAGAGYLWSAEVLGPDGVIGIEVTAAPSPAGPPGTSADEVLRLQALRPGHVRVVLRLRRPWTPDVELEYAEIDVDVEG